MPRELSAQAEQILHYLESARNETGSMRVTPEHPISGALLASRFGLKGGAREVRDLVHEIRTHGHWIAANTKGYFAAREWSEIAETVRTMKKLSKSIAVPANAMAARAEKQEQLSLI